MCVLVSLGVLAASLSLFGCPHHNQAAYVRLLTSPHVTTTSPHVTTAIPVKPSPPRVRKTRSRRPPHGHQSASLGPFAANVYYVAVDPVGSCVVVDFKPETGKIIGDKGGYASLESANGALKTSKAKCEDELGTRGFPTTLNTVQDIANALDLGKTDQAVRTAKAYINRLKESIGTYYWGLVDRVPSEQAGAAINLVPGSDLFDRPKQGMADLRLLRWSIEKEVAIDEIEAKSNKFAESRQKANERRVSGQYLIRTIGTDESLENALSYLDALHAKPDWHDFVTMLNGVIAEDAEVKFKAAQTKANKLGGAQMLTREDIDGLSYQQIKQLRGY